MRGTLGLALGALLVLSGCGTVNSYANGCPGVYGGVRQDLDLLESYGSEAAAYPESPIGFDLTLADAWDRVFVALDVPLAAIADTVALPATLGREPQARTPVAPGCGWAAAPPAPAS